MGIRMVIGYQAKETLQSRSPLKSAQFPRSILRFARQTMSHHCEVTAQFLAQSPPDKGNEGAIFFRFAGTRSRCQSSEASVLQNSQLDRGPLASESRDADHRSPTA